MQHLSIHHRSRATITLMLVSFMVFSYQSICGPDDELLAAVRDDSLKQTKAVLAKGPSEKAKRVALREAWMCLADEEIVAHLMAQMPNLFAGKFTKDTFRELYKSCNASGFIDHNRAEWLALLTRINRYIQQGRLNAADVIRFLAAYRASRFDGPLASDLGTFVAERRLVANYQRRVTIAGIGGLTTIIATQSPALRELCESNPLSPLPERARLLGHRRRASLPLPRQPAAQSDEICGRILQPHVSFDEASPDNEPPDESASRPKTKAAFGKKPASQGNCGCVIL